MYKKLTLVLIYCSFLFSPKVFARCAEIVAFPDFSKLSSFQQEQLMDYLPTAKTTFAGWSLGNTGLATEFLANTQALSHLYIKKMDGSWVPATDLVHHINKIEGDRMKVSVQTDLFNDWRNAGANFQLYRADGKVERGHFNFNHGNLGGSRHKGYDMQGYTSMMKVPRIQINYRFSDSEADIDLDAYHPWIAGFIPNFRHLSWNNSDPRCWIKDYEKKFGKLFLGAK